MLKVSFFTFLELPPPLCSGRGKGGMSEAKEGGAGAPIAIPGGLSYYIRFVPIVPMV